MYKTHIKQLSRISPSRVNVSAGCGNTQQFANTFALTALQGANMPVLSLQLVSLPQRGQNRS